MKKYGKYGFLILLLTVLPAMLFTQNRDTQNHDTEIWDITRFSTMVDFGIGIRLNEKADDEAPTEFDEALLGIRGGLDGALTIVPINLGFMNLGVATGLVTITREVTETDSFYSVLIPINLTAVKYVKRMDWDAFPYFVLSPGVCAQALFAWNKTSGITVVAPEAVPPPAAEEETEDSVPAPDDQTMEPVEKKLIWGGGVTVAAGALTPLNQNLYLDLKCSLKLYYTNYTFYKFINGSIGITLSF